MTVFRERKLQSRWDTRLFNSLRDLIESRNVARLKFPFVHFVDARKLSHRFSIIFLQARLCIKRERDENGTRPFNFTSVSIHRRAFFLLSRFFFPFFFTVPPYRRTPRRICQIRSLPLPLSLEYFRNFYPFSWMRGKRV